MSFSHQTLTQFSEILGELYAAETPEAALQAILPGLSAMLNARQMSIDELPYDGRPPIPRGGLHLDELGDAVERYPNFVHEHPAVQFVRAGGFVPVYRIRDFDAPRKIEDTGFYCEIFRPNGIHDQLCIAARLPDTGIAITVHRDTLFTEEEAQLAALLQPHVAAAIQGRRAIIPSLPAATERTEWRLPLSIADQPISIDGDWAKLLKRYFPTHTGPHANKRLPEELSRWTAAQIARLRELQTGSPAIGGWTICRPAGRLHLQVISSLSGEGHVLQARENRGTEDFFRLRSRGLTARECEIAFWVAQGKRDSEIALIAGCATRTVSKHVENVLSKTGAETRLGATHILAEWLRGSG